MQKLAALIPLINWHFSMLCSPSITALAGLPALALPHPQCGVSLTQRKNPGDRNSNPVSPLLQLYVTLGKLICLLSFHSIFLSVTIFVKEIMYMEEGSEQRHQPAYLFSQPSCCHWSVSHRTSLSPSV